MNATPSSLLRNNLHPYTILLNLLKQKVELASFLIDVEVSLAEKNSTVNTFY